MKVLEKPIISGTAVFNIHWYAWHLLGQSVSAKDDTLYKLYAFLLNAITNVFFPLHLITAIFSGRSENDIFQNLSINVTVTVISIQGCIVWWKMPQIRRIYNIIVELDKRVIEADELHYYQFQVINPLKRLFKLYCFVIFSAYVMLEGSVFVTGLTGEWRLMYPMYFPFDIDHSGRNFAIANFYQLVSFTMIAGEALFFDSYISMTMALLGAHVHLLGMRISRLGYDREKSAKLNNEELLFCINEYENIIVFHTLVENTIAWMTFTQIVSFGLNIGLGVVYLFFYVDDFIIVVFYILYMGALSMQLFPTCYFGNNFEMEYDKFTYCLFSCNWIEQDVTFKRNLSLFSELSLKRRKTKSGFYFNINLDTFFSACKGAYSLLALLSQMK